MKETGYMMPDARVHAYRIMERGCRMQYRKQVQDAGYRIQNTRVQGEDWMQDRDAVCTIQK